MEPNAVAAEVVAWLNPANKNPDQNSIPPQLVQDALAWASRESTAYGSICTLSTLAKDQVLIQEFLADIIQKRILTGKDDPNNLEKVARLVQDSDFDPGVINSYEIRLMLAEALAKIYSPKVCINIKSFNLNEEDRLKIARLCAQFTPNSLILFIEDFGIVEQETLGDLAIACAQSNGYGTAEHIKNFGIIDEKVRIEIAKSCAQENPTAILDYLENFDITDQLAIFEIAKICAVNRAETTAIRIKKFNLKDENDRIEIAKLCAADTRSTGEYIENFEITNRNALIEIAKIHAQTSPYSFMPHFEKFGITDQGVRIEIAKLDRMILSGCTLDHFENFKITDQAARIDIAKCCAQQVGRWTAQQIKNFKIEDQHALIEIAKLCASSDGEGTAEYIEKFGITDENTLFEIALLCAQDKNFTGEFIPNFGITDDKMLIKIFATALMESEQVLKFLPESAPDNNWSLLYTARDSLKTKENILEVFNGNYANELQDILQGELDRSKILWFVGAVTYLSQSEWGQENGILRLLANMQRIDLRNALTHIVCRLASRGIPVPKLEGEPWKIFTGLLYADLDIDKELLEKIRRISEQKESKYQVYTGYNPLIEMLVCISKSMLKATEKEAILRRLLPNLSLVDVRSIIAIFLFGEPKRLLQEENAQDILEKLLKEKLSLGSMEGLAEKYLNTFGASRFPTAISIYAAKLIGHKDQKAIEAVTNFIIQVLNGTFKDDRYNVEKSIHLNQIENFDKNILTKWKEGLSAKVDEGVAVKVDRPKKKDWLTLKLKEEHLPIMHTWKVNYIQRYLEGDEGVKQALTEELKIHRPKQGEFNELRFQMTLIEYAESDHKSEIAILNRLIKSVKQLNQPAFFNDLDGEIKTLQEMPVTHQNLMVFDSDDPYDLLLCGTEVYGSCQAVEGDPNLNRGVLGYLLNGWNRVLKVSAGKDEPMIARCKLQLLWDGEKPVLFREKIYSKGNPSPQHEAALNALALQKAKELGVPLLYLVDKGEKYGKTLYALGGPAPYEYSDAAGPGVLWEYGNYSFEGACLLKLNL